ncbi:MAG: glycerophosphoryl diester phosphodiesterase [Gammaproteobacteria bacterium]
MIKWLLSTQPWVIAHRGASGYAPENTIPAMQRAKEMGATWVEFDVVLSRDGELFVFHDEKLNRTTNGSGLIAQTDAAQIKLLDAGAWFSSLYKNTSTPTLDMILSYLAEVGLGMNLEIKPADDRIELLVNKIFDAIERHWTNELPPPLISSFSIPALYAARKRSPTARLGLLLHEWRKDWRKIADDLNCYSVHLNMEIITKRRIQAIHSSGRPVLCYTVNNSGVAKQLFDMGVDGIFSNYPDLMEK